MKQSATVQANASAGVETIGHPDKQRVTTYLRKNPKGGYDRHDIATGKFVERVPAQPSRFIIT